MQINYTFNINLSEYTRKIKQKNWNFPDFSDTCPICKKTNCAVRIGFYWRWVFVFELEEYLHIPVARYLCRKTGKTFSLLPSQCIPYMLYDIDSLMFMAGMKFKNNMNLLDIASEFSALSETASVSSATVFKYLVIFMTAHNKMLRLLKLKHVPWQASSNTYGQWVDKINDFPGKGVSYTNHIYQRYALFLFGTPSQAR